MKDKVTQIPQENLHWLLGQSIETKIGLIQNHLEMARIFINQVIQEDVNQLAGERYSHDKPHNGRYSRWGRNPGSVPINDVKVQVEVPRIMDAERGESFSPESYEKLKKNTAGDERLMQALLHGVSTRDFAQVFGQMGQAFGLSRSNVSNRFIEASTKALEEFEARKFTDNVFAAIYVDGKYFGGDQMIIVMGVTDLGNKVPLGFVQSATENANVVKALFRDLIKRGLKVQHGVLFVIDGSKGIFKAIQDCFGNKAVVQRCYWHKIQNILSYLPEKHHEMVKTAYYSALNEGSYSGARQKLMLLHKSLNEINRSAAKSLLEGLEELLSLHKMNVPVNLRCGFTTTNNIENLNSQLGKYMGRVKWWRNSSERHRWLAAALLNAELRMRKVRNHKRIRELMDLVHVYLKKKKHTNKTLS